MTASTLIVPPTIILLASVIAVFVDAPLRTGRWTITRVGWLLALAPLSACLILVGLVPQIPVNSALVWQFEWLPSFGLTLGFYYDQLSALFAILVSGIGTLIVIYTGYYFKTNTPTPDSSPGNEHGRFVIYLLLFMFCMLGLVMAGDIITLFMFWEGTSITSFLLVAYKTKDAAARQGAFQALFITGGGGIALLAGLLMVAAVAGDTTFTSILASGDALRSSAIYPIMLLLVAFGAFTKSAQAPAHIWLPRAMTAPTPASAFLHSATMVKAGIYLMARMNPALGFTELWFYLLTGFGLLTMLVGAYLGLKQNDLKALLAYSTISQLGVMMAMIGQDVANAFKALVIAIVAHALYKSTLFMVAGIVDHETGTRDLRRLGGLRRAMPVSFVIAAVAGLSMAGLPPMFGFLAKETLLTTATHPGLPPLAGSLMTVAAVVAGALLLAQAGLFVWDTFLGKPRDPTIHGHEPPRGMLLAPAVPAALSLLIGLAPEPQRLADFLARAAQDAYSDTVKVSLALWTGLNVPFVLSLMAISLGLVIFAVRHPLRTWLSRTGDRWGFQQVYVAVLAGIDRAAGWATRLQGGKLRTYLSLMLAAVLILLVAALGMTHTRLWNPGYQLSVPELTLNSGLVILRMFAVIVVLGAALATIVLQRDIAAVVALSASGLAVAVLFVLTPAPDVALVQVVVDILSVVILILALTRLPRRLRALAQQYTFKQTRGNLLRDSTLATGAGLVVGFLTLIALVSQPRQSLVTPYYEANAKTLTGATDVVGAIVIDFRGFDTLLEITVFAMAGLGVYTLLRYAARSAGDQVAVPPPARGRVLPTLGVAGPKTSPFIRALAYAILPLAMMIGITHVMYGHDQPGDGFTAGVIMGLGVAFWYVAMGYEKTKRRLTWLRPRPLIAGGLLLAIMTGVVSTLLTGRVSAPVDYDQLLGLPLPAGFGLSSSFFFELAICLTVLGSVSFMIDILGHPGDDK